MAEYGGKTVIFNKEDVNAGIQQYEEETVTHFVVAGMTPSYSQTELCIKTIRWNLTGYEGLDIPYDGIPFCWIGRKYLVCQFGKKKTNYKVKDSAEAKKSRQKKTKHTKKHNCPAKVTIKKIVKFPEFKVETNQKQAKTDAKNKLLAALDEDRESVEKNIQYYVKFSAIEEHQNHDMGEDAAKVEPIDQRVKAKLDELAQTGVSSCTVLHSLVHTYVVQELFKDQPVPPKSRRRYFPRLKDVQNFMTRWRKKSANNPALSVPQAWEDMEEEQEVENVMMDGQIQDDEGQVEHVEHDNEEIVVTESSNNILEQVVIHTQEVDSDSMQEDGQAISEQQVPSCTLIIQQKPSSDPNTQQWTISNSQTQSLSSVTGTQELPSTSDAQSHILNSANLQLNSSIEHLSRTEDAGGNQQLSEEVQQEQIINVSTADHMYVSGSEQQVLELVPVTDAAVEQEVSHQEQLVAQSTEEEQTTLLTLMNTVLLNSSLQQGDPNRTSIPVTVVQESKPKRKVQRIGYVRQMKEVMHDILDYSLLVKDVEVLQGFLEELEKMRSEANTNATLDAEVVKRELARNRRKRPAELHDLNSTGKRLATHLSDVL